MVLQKKVGDFIVSEIKKSDKEFSIYFSGDVSAVVKNKAIIDKINNDSGGAIGYRNRKINEWCIKFIERLDVDFQDKDCKEIFEEIKKMDRIF